MRVRDGRRLGAVDQGWKVALVTLMNERLAVGGSSGPNYAEMLELARSVLRAGPPPWPTAPSASGWPTGTCRPKG